MRRPLAPAPPPRPRRPRLTHQVIPRIGDRRGAGVGNHRHTPPRLQTREKAPALITLVVLMTGRQGRRDTEVLHQPRRMAGVLGRDQGDATQNGQRPGTDVGPGTEGGGPPTKSAAEGGWGGGGGDK